MDGHAVVNANLIREFILRRHEITFCYFSEARCQGTELFVRSLGVSKVEWSRRRGKISRVISLLRYLTQREGLSEELTVLGSNAMLDYHVVSRGKRVLLAGDVETRKWAQKKSFETLFSYLCSAVRERIYRHLDIVVLYNQSDLAFLPRSENVLVHPVCYNAVPVDSVTIGKEYDIIFTGNFSYAPNEEAASFIVKRFSASSLKVALIGYGADRYEGCGGNFVIKDGVPSVEQEIMKSRVYVSPLIYGTGVKNKVLSAVNCGVPLVCTPLSIEGIPFLKDAPSVRVCSNRAEIELEIGRVLDDIDYYNASSLELKSRMDSVMSWAGFAEQLEIAIEKL